MLINFKGEKDTSLEIEIKAISSLFSSVMIWLPVWEYNEAQFPADLEKTCESGQVEAGENKQWGSLEVTVGELKEELWEKENRLGRAG